MAKKKKKKKDPHKYKKTIINKLIDANKEAIIEGYFQSRGEEIPKYKKYQKKALAAFKNDITGIMKNESNKELTATELFKKVINTEKFTSREERTLENFYQTQKKFFNYIVTRSYTNKKEGIEYTRDIIMPKYKKDQIEWDEKRQLYKIVSGKDVGKYFVTVHLPGQNPSYKLVLRTAEELDAFLATGQIN